MGARYNWTVEVETFPGLNTWIPIPNVQGVSIDYGRTQPTDDFPAGRVSISGVLPNSLPAIFSVVGSKVRLKLNKAGPSTIATFYCRVRSLSRTYGTTYNLDTWSFTGLGDIGLMAEQQLTSDYTTTAGRNTCAEISNLLSTYGIQNSYSPGESFISATTFTTGTYINDIVQTLIRTEQGRLEDVESPSGIDINNRSQNVAGFAVAYFNDGSMGSFGGFDVAYTSVEFLNTGEYKASSVIVEPDGLAPQIAGSGRPVLNFNTLDQSTAQAANLAGYIKNTLDLNTSRPFSVTVLADALKGDVAIYAMATGSQVRLYLRGALYNCIVEGMTIQGNPSATELTFHLSSSDAYAFLRLDDAVFGTLDYNRLGF